MNDYIIRATAAEGMIRGFFATTKETANKGFTIHQTSPVVTAALGRMLTAAAIFGSMLKNDDDIITLAIKGDGPMKGVVATSDCKSRVKGYAYENQVDLPLKPNGKLDVANAIGDGFMTVIRDIGLKEPYVGKVPLVSGEIAEDLTFYFSNSEQVPSAVALGVLVDTDYTVKQAGGFIVQLMPGATEEVINQLEDNIRHLPPLTTLYEEGKTPEDVLELLLGNFGFTINDQIPVEYYCNCTRERVEKALISVGRTELNDILEKDKKAELHCHFCNTNYQFNQEDLENLLTQI